MHVRRRTLGFGRGFVVCSAAALALTTFAGPVVAHSNEQDNRRCVSKVEYQSASGAPIKNMSRKDLEERWEVAGLGRKGEWVFFLDLTFWRYPACDYSLSEKYYGAAFFGDNFPDTRQTGLYAVLEYRSADPIPGCDERACRPVVDLRLP